jgi:hypothetical protein
MYKGIFREIPLPSIAPQGWLKKYLEIQVSGLTGNIEAAGPPFDDAGWGMPFKKVDYPDNTFTDDWWPYEQTGYWLDGAISAAFLVNNRKLINRAVSRIDTVLDSQAGDGYLGPDQLRNPEKQNRWAHAVFFRALRTYYSVTKDERILTALIRHYTSKTSSHSEGREVVNAEIMLWLYGITGDKMMLESARDSYTKFLSKNGSSPMHPEKMLEEAPSREHGVSFNEIAKLAAIFPMYIDNPEMLRAVVNGYEKIQRDQVLAGGVCSSSEYLAGKDPLDSYEICDIADYTWSLGYLLMATGNTVYADRIEYAVFNAAPGAVTSDFKALQYFSCANQVVAGENSNHNLFRRGEAWMSFSPSPGTQCCPGNINRIMPNYIGRMWLAGEEGPAALMYGPSAYTHLAGDKKIYIEEKTLYPFDDVIHFHFDPEGPSDFAFTLRIPEWCRSACVTINDKIYEQSISGPEKINIKRLFSKGDTVSLHVPMHLYAKTWPKGGVSLHYGPLTLSLPVPAKREIQRTFTPFKEGFSGWNFFPDGDWNFGLYDLEKTLNQAEVKIDIKNFKSGIWDSKNSPLQIKIPAFRIPGWNIQKTNKVETEKYSSQGLTRYTINGDFLLTPELPTSEMVRNAVLHENEVKICLIPYGFTELRLTVFPGIYY